MTATKTMIRHRISRIFENLFAMAIGAVIVALVNGMPPAEILDLALTNADKLPGLVSNMVTETFGTDILAS